MLWGDLQNYAPRGGFKALLPKHMYPKHENSKKIMSRTLYWKAGVYMCGPGGAAYRKCLLKALWGGHTAALHFMLGQPLQFGERKHAILCRRLPEEDIMTACIAKSSPEMVLICLNVGLRKNVFHELAPLKLSKSCFPPRAGRGYLLTKWWQKQCENMRMPS